MACVAEEFMLVGREKFQCVVQLILYRKNRIFFLYFNSFHRVIPNAENAGTYFVTKITLNKHGILRFPI